MRKHIKEKRSTCRNLHLALNAATHKVIAAEVNLESVADSAALPTLFPPETQDKTSVS